MASTAESETPAPPGRPPPEPAAQQPRAAQDFDQYRDEIDQLSEISRNAQGTFLALLGACVYSFLTIANITDAELLSDIDAAPLPIIQVNVPTGGFFALAPLILALMFVYFHLYLERFWRCVVALPLHHKDGRGLDDYIYPWLISCAFIRGEIRPLAGAKRRGARIEAWLALSLGWGLVPFVLLCYWARYLVAHDWPVTLLHVSLFSLSLGVALHFVMSTRNSLRRMEAAARTGDGRAVARGSALGRGQRWIRAWVPAAAAAALVYLSWVAFERLVGPACDVRTAPAACKLDWIGRRLWRAVDRKPFIEVPGTRFVPRPSDWDERLKDRDQLNSFLDGQHTLVLRHRDLRGLVATEAFLPGSLIQDVRLGQAELESATLARSRLVGVDLEGSNLKAAKFRFADITDSVLRDVQATFANFDEATITRGSLATELSGVFSEASFVGIRAAGVQVGRAGDGASLLQPTSLRDARLTSGTFSDARFDNVDMTGAKLVDADFRGAAFTNVEFTEADLSGSDLTGAAFTGCRFLGRIALDKSAFADARFIDSRFNSTGSADDELPQQRKDLSHFSARGARFDARTQFVNLRIVDADLLSATFDGTILRKVLFVDTDLSDARFTNGVDLSHVEFDRVTLSGADLRGARGVTASLLAGACGNAATRLPQDLKAGELKPCP